ncbi:unnamed protein product, partial [Pocillopora meandrina]
SRKPLCGKSRKCSKPNSHQGRCDSSRTFHAFWKSSSSHVALKRKGELQEQNKRLSQDIEAKKARLDEYEGQIQTSVAQKDAVEEELQSLQKSVEEKEDEVKQQEEKVTQLNEQYHKFKSLLEQKGFSVARRKNASTTCDMITNVNSSTKYRRRQETKNVLEFIHGGKEGSIYGAWDYISSTADNQTMDTLISGLKRGKYLQGLFDKTMKGYQNSDEALKQAVFMKYQNFLSRRKYALVCKTQSSVFDPNSDLWVPRNIKCLGLDLRVPNIAISDKRVENFVRSLDIGHVNQIPNAPGVSRTITGLVFMIIDLHLRLPYLFRKLIWFNDNINHFIMQFSDDGAPESSQLTMSIGSLTSWNFGDRVRSRDFQYILHCVSRGEKDEVLQSIWKQHTDEMEMLEGNIFVVSNKQCTVEFQPSADMSWQSWANNELNQAATYPSPYANVSKGNMCTMGATIGMGEEDLFKPYTLEVRNSHVKRVNEFMISLPSSLNEKNRHSRKLQFMAENGIRQLGTPRIGIGINDGAGERSTRVDFVNASNQKFVCDLDNALSSNHKEDFGELGRGLGYLASVIKDHYNDEAQRHKKLPVRLIGDQAIALANFSFRLIDALKVLDESPAQKLERLALGKIAQFLRNAGALFNKIEVSPSYLGELTEFCTLYFNLHALFFSLDVNVTVWTVGYAIPYHATKLYESYKVGYGIISLQAKEAKHSGVKNDLDLTNRSNKTTEKGKWWQVMRANYVRAFYLPEHQPMPSSYTSRFKFRLPSQLNSSNFCNCGREKEINDYICEVCVDARVTVQCAEGQQLIPEVLSPLKPVLCSVCNERFPDTVTYEAHKSVHLCSKQPVGPATNSRNLNPRNMKVSDLKMELQSRQLSTSGNKDVLIRRLEGTLASETI